MDNITSFLILMLAVTVFALLASKIGIPYPTMMVVGGLVICLLPGLKKVEIEPRLIFNIFLPPLLYGAAWQTSWKDFWTNGRSIFFLAVGLVLFTTAGVAVLAMLFIPFFTWPSAFALGAIVSPPDAIAVTALTKKIRLPKRVVLLLEGESLVNDASALVTLKFAVVAAVTGTFSIAEASGQFVLVSAGGVILGLLIGWTAAEVHRRMRDPLIETTITFLTPYAAFLAGEQLHMSGVLATVTAGLYVSWRAPEVMKPQVRLEAFAVWNFVLFMLNGFVFVLVGFGLQSALQNLPPDLSPYQLIRHGLLITAGVIVLRMAWVVPGTYLAWLFRRRRSEARPSMRHTLLVGWTGMRGVVSLAAALALPMYIDSAETIRFPARNMIIFIAFFIILITLVIQSLTLPMVIRLLGAHTADDEVGEERDARLHAARAALAFLKDLTESTDAFGEVGTALRAEYEQRIMLLESGPIPLPIAAVGIDTSSMDLHREVLSAERQAIVELRANQKITTEVFQRLMSDVDAEELRLPSRG